MALSQPLAPLSILCSARNNANFLLLLLLPTPPPLNILLKRYKIPCATCVCVPYLLLFTSMTNEIIRAPAPRTTYAVAQMPLAGMRATATQIYFTSPKMLCTLCRWAIFYFLRSCSVCFFLCSLAQRAAVFLFLLLPFPSTSSTPKIIFIFCGVIFAHI